MPFSSTAKDNEKYKFFADSNGDATVRVNDSFGSILADIEWQSFDVTYPSTTQEVYQFYSQPNQVTLVATITLNYTDNTKEFLLNGTRS